MYLSFAPRRLGLSSKIVDAYSGGPVGHNGSERDSHGSLQIRVVEPLPIALPSCVLSRSRPKQIPLHPCEAEFGTLQSKKEDDVQYLPNRTLANKQVGLLSILQLILARRASLKLWISLKPSPPSLFDKRTGISMTSFELSA